LGKNREIAIKTAWDKLPQAIFTPATKEDKGHDINVTQEYIEKGKQYLDSGNDIAIFGHIHRPLLVQVGEKTICNTGEWIRKYSYAKMENGTVSLWEYKPGGDSEEIKSEAGEK